MDFAPVDQTGFHALPHGLHERLLEDGLAPTAAGFAENTKVGNRVLQAVAQEPQIIQPLRQPFHQLLPNQP